MKTCIQCGEPSNSNYCSNCGQKQNIRRLTLASFFSDFFSRIYGLDGAFPNTIIGLTKNPAKVAQDYIRGIRGKYVGPVGYYFLIFTIFFLLVQLSDYTLNDYLPKTENFAESIVDNNNLKEGQNAREIALAVKQRIFNNLQYVHVFLVPILAFWCGVWFKKSNYNFIENTVLSFFIHAQGTVVNLNGFVIFIFTGLKNNTIINLIIILYYAWSMSLFYTGKAKLSSLCKGLIAYLFTYISFLLFVAVIVLISLIVRGRVS
ncbi:Protein of unknown function [Reichenbachiella faecimaris]|uniref:DUF3667 domain-containing protein n=1 Tax=Reichenbachiella faecimaris TaxID=692418 RepID=A0A1W2G9V5_REIFA|nr:DUF3667 domain-containing protein [Reichenbachiella faecimaris]SMD33252.1 Protein of unknown function [Reichenbachiella faecimaris]